MFVDAENDWVWWGIELELEIRVAQTIAQRLNVQHSGARKGCVNDALDERCGQRAARLRPEPAGFFGCARNHGLHYRRSFEANRGSFREFAWGASPELEMIAVPW